MPKRVTRKAPPPALSSESSSLSSAPEIAEIEAEAIITTNTIDKALEDIPQDLIEGSGSRPSKRRRTATTTEVTTPTKRVKRSSKATQQSVKEEEEPTTTIELGQSTKRRTTKARASKSNGVKAEQLEAVAGAIEDTAPTRTKPTPRRAKAAAKLVKVEEEGTDPETPKRVKRRNKVKEDETSNEKKVTKEEEADIGEPKKVKRKKKIKEQEVIVEGVDAAEPKKVKKKRKTKEEKELEAMPIAARTTGLKMFIGAHVSAAKGRSCGIAIASPINQTVNRLLNLMCP